MTGIIVGGKSQYLLLGRHDRDGEIGKIVVTVTTPVEVSALAMGGNRFAMDVDEFVNYGGPGIYMLIKGEIIVPVVKVQVGYEDVEMRDNADHCIS